MRGLAKSGIRVVAAALACLVLFMGAIPIASAKRPVYIAIIIDDIGNNWVRDLQAIRLPGPVALAVLPQLEHSTRAAQHAFGRHKDVILHLPLEPVDRVDLLGPGSLRTNMNARAISESFAQSLASVPHAIAVSNHMGSRFTRDTRAMDHLMTAMKQHRPDLFFIDTVTIAKSVGPRQAAKHGISILERSIFLDNERSEQAIEEQFEQLLEIAKRRGWALAIGHPHPETLAVLRRRLQPLSQGDVRLVPVSMLMAMQSKGNK